MHNKYHLIPQYPRQELHRYFHNHARHIIWTSTMIIHREIGSSFHHKPMVQRVDYSPLMMENSLEALVKEERRREVTPVAVPPPIFLLAAACSPLLYIFDLHLAMGRERLGDPLYS